MKSSIVLTTYNGSKFIIELLDSIKNQTRKPDEVIIVDDVSTDDTASIVKEYIEKYALKNWHIIINDNNIGWKKNFRKAISLCTGEIIMFCDQDDIWHEDKVDVMCNIIEQNKDIKVLISNYVLLSQGNKNIKVPRDTERDDGTLEEIKGYKKIGTISRPGCTFALKKEIADLMLKYDNVLCAHDHVVYNLGLVNGSLYIINRQLIDFRRHTNNASTSKKRFGKERKAIEAKERVDVCDILLKYCISEKKHQLKKAIIVRKHFYLERMKIFNTGNIINMLSFAASHLNQYNSSREIAVDLIAMLK